MLSAIYPSPPQSPVSDYFYYDEPAVVATNDLGMIADETAGRVVKRRKRQDVKVVRKKSEPRKYVSKHFTQAKSSTRKLAERKKVKSEELSQDDSKSTSANEAAESGTPAPPAPAAAVVKEEAEEKANPNPQPLIIHGLNINDLSTDSELSSVPSDIGPDPFPPSNPDTDTDTLSPAFKVKKKPSSKTKSPYFPNTIHRHRQHFLTTLPFPPLSSPHFGLMQERLAHDPYRLLLATIFLNKTPGERAMPIFFELMKRYPTPTDLSRAEVADVTEIIRTLGFQNQRARKCVAMAKAWADAPPEKGRRYRKLNYPCKGDGRDVKEGEVIGEDDERVAWEISHLPGLGPYSHDSWRMFCRDRLKGLATGWLGEGAEEGFEPEWKRVLPLDKELRAWMTWMWLKEGWVWNKETGKLTKADEELLRLARDGGVVQETKGNEHLIVKGLDQETVMDKAAVEKPAGDFVPG